MWELIDAIAIQGWVASLVHLARALFEAAMTEREREELGRRARDVLVKALERDALPRRSPALLDALQALESRAPYGPLRSAARILRNRLLAEAPRTPALGARPLALGALRLDPAGGSARRVGLPAPLLPGRAAAPRDTQAAAQIQRAYQVLNAGLGLTEPPRWDPTLPSGLADYRGPSLGLAGLVARLNLCGWLTPRADVVFIASLEAPALASADPLAAFVVRQQGGEALKIGACYEDCGAITAVVGRPKDEGAARDRRAQVIAELADRLSDHGPGAAPVQARLVRLWRGEAPARREGELLVLEIEGLRDLAAAREEVFSEWRLPCFDPELYAAALRRSFAEAERREAERWFALATRAIRRRLVRVADEGAEDVWGEERSAEDLAGLILEVGGLNLILGAGGAGKTALLRAVGRSLLDRGAAPLSLMARDLVASEPSLTLLLSAYLSGFAARWCEPRARFDVPERETERLLAEGRVVLLVDGLEELQGPHLGALAARIQRLLDRGLAVIVAARERATPVFPGARAFRLAPIDDDERRRFLASLVGERRAEELALEIKSLGLLADQPLSLLLAARLERSGRRLTTAAGLFEGYARLVLGEAASARDPSVDEALRFLEDLSLRLLIPRTSSELEYVPEDQRLAPTPALLEALVQDREKPLLRRAEGAGLLVEEDGRVAFLDRGFHESFAGEALARDLRAGGPRFNRLLEALRSFPELLGGLWARPLRFAIESLMRSRQPDLAERILRELWPDEGDDPLCERAALVLRIAPLEGLSSELEGLLDRGAGRILARAPDLAVPSLAEGGERAESLLIEALVERVPEPQEAALRRRIAAALGERRGSAARAALERALRDPDALTRRAAVLAIGRFRDDRALSILATAAASADPVVREAAAIARRLRAPPPLARRASRREPPVEAEAALDGPSFERRLRDLTEGSWRASLEAAILLARAPQVEAEAALETALAHPRSWRAGIAAQALSLRRDAFAVRILERALDRSLDRLEERWSVIAAALGQIIEPFALEHRLTRLSEGPRPRSGPRPRRAARRAREAARSVLTARMERLTAAVRCAERPAIIEAAGALGDSRASDALIARFEDAPPRLVPALIFALGCLKEARAEGLIAAALEADRAGHLSRRLALWALAEIGGARSVALLAAGLVSSDPRQRVLAAAGLARGGEGARAALLARIEDPRARPHAIAGLRALRLRDQSRALEAWRPRTNL